LVKENLNTISEILQKCKGDFAFDEFSIVANQNCSNIELEFNKKGIDFELEDNFLRLKLNNFLSPNFILFNNIYKKFEPNYVITEFSVLNITGEYCYHEANNNSLCFSSNPSILFVNVCQNLFSYYELYNFLKSDKFSDYHNFANREIVIYNSAKGIFKIKYESIPSLDQNTSIKKLTEELISISSKLEFNLFVKNSIITLSGGKDSIQLSEIIKNSEDIVSIANRDYALTSKQFDFEKFRDSLYKEKEKYFSSVREIINKIFSQAVGIPVSISAVVYTSYKASDDPIVLFLVMFSFIAYVVFYIRIQIFYREDLSEIKKDFESDFAIITLKSGLAPEIIDKEKTKIQTKIKSSLSMVNYLIYFVVGLGSLVCFYILYILSKSAFYLIICSIFKLFLKK